VATPLKAIAAYWVSNVDKIVAEGEIPVRLCNYTDVYNNEFIDLGLDFMRSTATEDEIRRFRLHVDDVVITKDSETWDDIAVPALVTQTADDLICGYHLAILRPARSRILGRFLFRCVQAKPIRVQLELASTGVTRFGLPKDEIGRLTLPIPPIREQQAITELLDRESARLDALVAAKQRLLDVIGDRRRAIIAHAVTRGLNPNAPLRDSGVPWLGKIPAHWETRRVKYLFRLVTDPAPEDSNAELLALYTDIGVRPRKELRARGNRATTTENYWEVKPGDLVVNKLLAWMGAFGVSAYEGVTSPAYDVLRPSSEVNPMYYHYLFRCGICFPEFSRRSSGIMDMRLRLYFDQLGDMRVPVPGKAEQTVIVDHIESETARLDALHAAAERTVVLLKERRAALIAAAVTGRTPVGAP
jgi:type I restriction enzyme S subunit